MDYISVAAEIDGQKCGFVFSVKDGRITMSEAMEKGMLEDSLFCLHDGRYFTAEGVEKGECVGLCSAGMVLQQIAGKSAKSVLYQHR